MKPVLNPELAAAVPAVGGFQVTLAETKRLVGTSEAAVNDGARTATINAAARAQVLFAGCLPMFGLAFSAATAAARVLDGVLFVVGMPGGAMSL